MIGERHSLDDLTRSVNFNVRPKRTFGDWTTEADRAVSRSMVKK